MTFSTALRFSSLVRSHLAAPLSPARHFFVPRFFSILPSQVLKARHREGPIEANGSVGGIVHAELHNKSTDAYNMAYGVSALPDVRDGLKPVQRRILFAMHEMGLSSRERAQAVELVLAKFHPSGATAIYGSLVRMAQDFSMRYPLIKGHGIFGSIDPYPPASMQYTRCSLEALTEAVLLADVDQNTVDFILNFYNSEKEPLLLPARIPTLLLNGSSGFAVGIATNIPPHNLGELVDVLCAFIHNPEVSLQELLEYMPGPDFPTGGLIMGNMGILKAYDTGKGQIVVRGKTEMEFLDAKSKRTAIVVKEIPYKTKKASLVETIEELLENKSLDGISSIRDESDRSGMRVVIELKSGSEPLIVLNDLYRLTPLQSTFNCNMIGILNGQPKVMGLKELLREFLDFRYTIVERRARFQLSQARERLHILEGIIFVLDNFARALHIMGEASEDTDLSADLVKEFNLSEKQAESVVKMDYMQLAPRHRKKFDDERKSLIELTLKQEKLLSCRQNILQLIVEEAIELKNKFSSTRRSVLLEKNECAQVENSKSSSSQSGEEWCSKK